MPKATVDTSTERYDLKTCEGGFVEIKRMPYGEWLTRSEIAMQTFFESQKGQKSFKGEMVMRNNAVTSFEFKNCIVNHNLEDADGNALDFRSPVALQVLDPRIGNEISEYIRELHEFDEGNSDSDLSRLSV